MATPSAAERAYTVTMAAATGRAQRETLEAGRAVVAESSTMWRRVTDGKPCGFCARMAALGPVFRSKSKAGGGRDWHLRCGCSVEPYDGDPDDWQPTPDEQRFKDAHAAVYVKGMTPAEVSTAMHRWLEDHPLADALSIDNLDDVEADALLARLFDEGDYDGATRVGELIDARLAAAAEARTSGAARSMAQDFHPAAYEWFENLSLDDQDAYLAQYANVAERDEFLSEQWAHIHKQATPKTAPVPDERKIRGDWDLWLESEFLKHEEATNGHALSRRAISQGRGIKDLYAVNERTARAWATEETLNYWDANGGRMTYGLFRDMYRGDNAAGRQQARNTYWTN